MSEDPLYDNWLARQRRVEPPAELTDRVMADVHEFENRRRHVLLLRLTRLLEQSVWSQGVVFCGALLVGSMPFLYLAYVAKLLSP